MQAYIHVVRVAHTLHTSLPLLLGPIHPDAPECFHKVLMIMNNGLLYESEWFVWSGMPPPQYSLILSSLWLATLEGRGFPLYRELLLLPTTVPSKWLAALWWWEGLWQPMSPQLSRKGNEDCTGLGLNDLNRKPMTEVREEKGNWLLIKLKIF